MRRKVSPSEQKLLLKMDVMYDELVRLTQEVSGQNMLDYLDDHQRAEFAAWAAENCPDIDISYSAWRLAEWNPKVWAAFNSARA